MEGFKGYLQSRSIWSSIVALVAFGLNALGFQGITDQAALTDALLQGVQVAGTLGAIFFRAVAKKQLGVPG